MSMPTSSSSDTPVSLCIRFANGKEDLSLLLPSTTSTIADLSQHVLRTNPAWQTQHLRFLFRGRILSQSSTINDLGVDVTSPDNLPLYIHCSVSETPASEPQVPDMTIARSMGLDRLLDLGFSREEVEVLRHRFHSMRGRPYANGEGEGVEAAAQAAEEEWIENTAVAQRSVEAVDGSSFDMLKGLFVGFFFGVIAILYLREPNVFNPRQQIGVICGLLISMSFGFLRM
ncbi:hypothetical protein SmJEL517_g01735 [Synchytrium microbalum]|uniref:Ubiquitin-like domain-containing protein n=1 Tax=Synchytrium microbalum TaxID=1806994 RepID=A0A507C8L5_9FUNG|nr:uncharacterized protein SmJEL517_g01735 [Synchytrium microbalum]TPX35861.1 hypothetical protein SmJEL517_g01735 [Synchytrium microbalum]